MSSPERVAGFNEEAEFRELVVTARHAAQARRLRSIIATLSTVSSSRTLRSRTSRS